MNQELLKIKPYYYLLTGPTTITLKAEEKNHTRRFVSLMGDSTSPSSFISDSSSVVTLSSCLSSTFSVATL